MSETNKKVPKVRFPEFADDWEQRKLGDITTIIDPHPSHRAPTEVSEGIPFIGIGDVDAMGNIDKMSARTVDETIYDEHHERYDLAIPSLGIGRVASLGKVIRLRNDIGKYAVSPTMSIIQIRDKVDINYLYSCMESPIFQKQFAAQSNGSTRQSVGIQDLRELSVSLPQEENEQNRIGEFFVMLDKTITLHQRELFNLEMQKKAVMKKIFSQEVRFKKADGSDFPEWEEKDLIELFPNIRNGFVGTVTDFFTEKEQGIRYLEGTNIHDGLISDNVELYVTKAFHKKHINNELKADDIVMVQSGHVGDCAVVGEKYAGANCHALIIMSNAGNCHSDFYVAYFHSPVGMKEIAIKSTGNTVKHILASVMQGFRVPYPCLEEQRLIAEFLSDFDEAIVAAKKELELWKELKKGLLQQMFV